MIPRIGLVSVVIVAAASIGIIIAFIFMLKLYNS